MDEHLKALIADALAVSENAYVPYSNFPVGAALKSTDGQVFTGCNVENAAYPAGICAERAALVKAVSAGQRSFETIAVVTRTGGTPCGICRQMLYEFAPALRVVVADLEGKIHHDLPLYELLKHGFGPQELG